MNVQQGQTQGSAIAGPHPARVTPAVFTSDAPVGPDRLGRATEAAFLAEVLCHREAGTPFRVGIFGPAGSGKSSFMAAVLAAVERLASGAAKTAAATPFLGSLVVARVEAQPGSAPAASIMRQVAAVLRNSHPELAAEASHAGLDPRAVARAAAERLDAARQALETERARLDALTGRRAQLVDHVLFETAGSRIDAFARNSRGRIERSWRGFGVEGEPLTAYKEAVREASEAGGPTARWAGALRVFWAYRGQGRLLVLAVALLLGAWGLGALLANEGKLIDTVRGASDKMDGVADWLQSRWSWLRPAKLVLEAGAVLALALNVVRGLRFLLPVHRGVALLRDDIENRRRDLDGVLAHQTGRVDALAREADAAARHAAEAESRLTAAAIDPGARAEVGGSTEDDVVSAFFDAVSASLRAGARDEPASRGLPVPARLVIGIDGFDGLPSPEAAAFLETARRLLDKPGIVTVMACDRAHLASGLAEADPALATAALNRLIQLPYALAVDGDGWPDAGTFARSLLEGDAGDGEAAAFDVAASNLDRPWTEGEMAAVEAAAALAGATPRSIKRFVNLYRIARADPRLRAGDARDLGALAVGLAVQAAGQPLYGPDTPDFDEPDRRLRSVRAAVGAALGTVLGAQDGRRGTETARTYGMGA